MHEDRSCWFWIGRVVDLQYNRLSRTGSELGQRPLGCDIRRPRPNELIVIVLDRFPEFWLTHENAFGVAARNFLCCLCAFHIVDLIDRICATGKPSCGAPDSGGNSCEGRRPLDSN